VIEAWDIVYWLPRGIGDRGVGQCILVAHRNWLEMVGHMVLDAHTELLGILGHHVLVTQTNWLVIEGHLVLVIPRGGHPKPCLHGAESIIFIALDVSDPKEATYSNGGGLDFNRRNTIIGELIGCNS